VKSWRDLPRERLLADVSLWSADLGHLAGAVRRLSAYADSFHFDVADAHFVPGLLFFPDLIRALRPHTELPLHVHLMADRPTELVAEFVSAGADLITVHAEIGEREVGAAIESIHSAGPPAGLALRLETPVSSIVPYLDSIDAILLLGTEVGVKGRELAPEACVRLREAAGLLRAHERPNIRLIADGGIRAQTVPLLREAGADAVVPGSLVFNSPDLEETFSWLHALPRGKL
jgi:ribulose-phosphate 3-epimerase